MLFEVIKSLLEQLMQRDKSRPGDSVLTSSLGDNDDMKYLSERGGYLMTPFAPRTYSLSIYYVPNAERIAGTKRAVSLYS